MMRIASHATAVRAGQPHERLRVLVLSHLFPRPDFLTSGPFVHEQVRALREHAGIDARVVTCRPLPVNCFRPSRCRASLQAFLDLSPALEWHSWDGVPTVCLPYFAGGLVRRWLHGRTYAHAVMRGAPWLRHEFSPHLIHAHTAYLDGGAAQRLAAHCGVPYVITEHTGPFSLLTRHPLIRRWTQSALKGAARIWCVSDSLAREVGSLVGASLPTLGNGVDTQRFRPPEAWSPSPKRPRLLAVMSLDANKDPLGLLAALRDLRARLPGVRLTLVGRGPLESRVRSFVADHGLADVVTLRDVCTRDEVARLMREACDVLVLSSRSETFGVVLIEALASGKPVVATRCGGPESIVTHPRLGRLCPPGDPAALAAALAHTIAELPRFDPVRIRAHAVEVFDDAVLARRLRTEYEQLLDQHGRSALPGHTSMSA